MRYHKTPNTVATAATVVTSVEEYRERLVMIKSCAECINLNNILTCIMMCFCEVLWRQETHIPVIALAN